MPDDVAPISDDAWGLIGRAADAVDALGPRSTVAETLRLAAAELEPAEWLVLREVLVGRMDLGRPGR